MDDCLLASPDLLSLVGKISVVCVTFSNFVQHLALSTTGISLSGGDSDMMSGAPDTRLSEENRYFLHDPIPLSRQSVDDCGRRSHIRLSQGTMSNSDDSILTRVCEFWSINFYNCQLKCLDYRMLYLFSDVHRGSIR